MKEKVIKLNSFLNKKKNITQTANELIDVVDISSDLLFKKNYTLGYLRVPSINIELLAESEKKTKAEVLTAEFKGEKEPFSFLAIPRTVDMEVYLDNLVKHYDEEIESPHRKMLLNEMIKDATKMIVTGSNYEHQFFHKVWKKRSENVNNSEKIIEEKLSDNQIRYGTIQLDAKRLKDMDILKLCNLFGNTNTAVLEEHNENNAYSPISWIKGE